MRTESVPFLRGVAVRQGQVVENPLGIPNPGVRKAGREKGVHFFACTTQNHMQEATGWAVERAKVSDGFEPYIVRFNLVRELFPVIAGRVSSLLFDRATRSYNWKTLRRFEELDLGCEVRLNAAGMQQRDLQSLGVIFERVRV